MSERTHWKTHCILTVEFYGKIVSYLACGEAPFTKAGNQRSAIALELTAFNGDDLGFLRQNQTPRSWKLQCKRCRKIAHEVRRQQRRGVAGVARSEDEARS